MAPIINRPEPGSPRTPESKRKVGLKPVAAAAILASLLVLGGCVRFGPQAEEMEKTASQSTKTDSQEENGPTSGAASDESAVSTQEESDSEEETPTQPENEADATDKSDTQADAAAGSGNKSAKDSASKDKPEIEAAVDRDDSQSMVTVELRLLPQGYSLVGMSWEPAAEDPANRTDVSSQAGLPIPGSASSTNGISGQQAAGSEAPASSAASERVTTTYHDAVLAGQAGSNGFFIDQDGQRIGYRYTEQQKGRSGILRLDFRDSDGATVGWEKTVILGTANSPADETERQGG